MHEWIEKNGGAEKVLTQLARMLPNADLLCLWNDDPDRFGGRPVQESLLSRTPLRRHKAAALLAMPAVWRLLRAEQYDWALVSTHLFAHHVKLGAKSYAGRKYAYVHTPARYIWTPELDHRGRSLPARLLSRPLKKLDSSRAQELAKVAANSKFVARRIEATWERESTVIYPPVEVDRIQSENDWRTRLVPDDLQKIDNLPAEFVLGASRLVRYKMLDQVLRVAKRARLPVVIAGAGPDLPRLIRIAEDEGVDCRFIGKVSDELLYALYQRCSLFVFPPIEDFGIMPVEAMAAGAAVMANRIGGAAETVVHGESGVLTNFASRTEIDEALDVIGRCVPEASRERAKDFSESRFRNNVARWIPEVVTENSPLATRGLLA